MTGVRPASALERCAGDVEGFLAKDWATQPHHHPNPGSRSFDDLLTIEDVDRLLSTTGLRRPAFRLVKDGATLPPSSYTTTGRISSAPVSGMADPGRILQLFQDGATIVFQGMHRFWLPLARFCRDLELALGHPTQVNVYITPPGARGLAVHQDAHDVFVLQAFGRKRWEVWPTGVSAEVFAGNGEGAVTGGRGAPILDVEMRPGDSLYLPLGTPHAARTQEDVSGHLTVGILSTTWRQVMHDVLTRLEADSSLDQRLPAGYVLDPSFPLHVRARLQDLQDRLGAVDADEVATRAIRRFLTSRASVLPGGFVDALALPTLTDRSVVRRRPSVACHLMVRDGLLSVLLGDRELRMPGAAEPAMRAVAERSEFRVGDLHDHLDEQGRLVLVRRLVREGLLEVASDG